MRYRKILVIANPASRGGKSREEIPRIKEFFESKGIATELYETRKMADAIRKVKKDKSRFDCIIAAGGDGTINEVINGLAGSKIPFGVIPLGTENVLAKGLNIPLNTMKACEFILSKKPTMIDLGKAKNRYFILMTGVGFDAYVASKIDPFFKKFLGITAYALKAIESLFIYEPGILKMTIYAKNKTK